MPNVRCNVADDGVDGHFVGFVITGIIIDEAGILSIGIISQYRRRGDWAIRDNV